ncbi:MAG: redoxin family protein [Planctomycetaceae bacterium]|nr:redoxin family protein [Planctomycetaceae bacterium]
MKTVQFPEKFERLNQPGRKLLVFLRHAGCPFCKQALNDVADARSVIEANGVQIVLVHMMKDRDQATAFFARYNLDDLEAISDPEQELYELLGVEKGKITDFLGPGVWLKGAVCTLWEGHLPGKPEGDVSQLGGVFLIEDGQILNSQLCRTSADRPDYLALSQPTSVS